MPARDISAETGRSLWLVPTTEDRQTLDDASTCARLLGRMGRVAMLGKPMNEAALAEAFALPFDALIELPWSPGHLAGGILEPGADAKLVVSITSRTAHELPVSALFTRCVMARMGAPLPDAADLETAVHEAVINAVIHGNLGLDSLNSTDVGKLESFITALTQRLDDARLSLRRVTLAAGWTDDDVWIQVADEGSGFDVTAARAAPEPNGASGRGVRIIETIAHKLEYDDGGRCACFWMSRRQGGAP